MNILLVHNPIAGRGRAHVEAERLAARLRADGAEVRSIESGRNGQVHEAGAPPDAIVVVGGDGTVHAFSDLARRLDSPLYQFPLGTENLFAREFGMSRRYETLRGALEKRRIERVDVASCNGHTFLLMVSVGPDAAIIHRLAAVRKGAIHHLSYLPHILSELLSPSVPTLSVTADGEPLIQHRRGLVVVANSRQYAMRIDPAKEASMRDGMLDVVFLPITRRLGLLKWLALSRLRMQDREGRITTRAREVVVQRHDGPASYQFDGEAGRPDADERTLRMTIEPGALPVLVP